MLTLPRTFLFGFFLAFCFLLVQAPSAQAAQLPVKPVSVGQDKKPMLRERIAQRLTRGLGDGDTTAGQALLGLLCAGVAVLIILATKGTWGWGLVGIIGLLGFVIGVMAVTDGETVAVKIIGVLDIIANAVFAVIGVIWLLLNS